MRPAGRLGEVHELYMGEMNEFEPPRRWPGLVKLIDHYVRMQCSSDVYP